ncbi:MAG: 4-hydroxy-tetrahydrodipicolinate synthase [Verrucomicrobia bacterium]|nr:4-hydroxy-tetrahydrodipicolinate synthase [Verrucomicrobiota bacterium]MCH8511761.1 4-hydroxy-tetrahydrodipicolinate synthase [Kiritimatiellia bacterium]
MFSGVYTAIVTPFTLRDGVDYEALDRLVDRQIAAGVAGIVPVGTTGESPTLSTPEHIEVIRRVYKRVAGRGQVVAGTGANATAEALELTQAAKEIGCEATLQVTPYYNKPSDNGLVAHFHAVADIGLPVMLYNVPGRAGKELSMDVIAACAEHPGIVAVKEAGGSVDRVSQILARMPELEVLSGDDPLTLPMMAVGACGVVSVASNAVPERVVALVSAALKGDYAAARKIHLENHRLFQTLLGLDTNPLPVKTALVLMGLVEDIFRLPLCSLDGDKREILEAELTHAGVLS